MRFPLPYLPFLMAENDRIRALAEAARRQPVTVAVSVDASEAVAVLDEIIKSLEKMNDP
jgi:hypothetical protein